MRFKLRNGINRKGTVVIFVLFVIAFASSIIINLSERSVNSYEEVNDVYLMNQAYIYGKTAVKIVKNLIEDDDFKEDSRDDDWFNIPMYPLQKGYISIKITPLNSKININDINSSNDSLSKRMASAWDGLMQEYEFNDTETTSDFLKDRIDNDTKISPTGIELERYDYLGNTYQTKNEKLSTLTELTLINKELYPAMKNHFTVIAEDKQININFVNENTLKYYLPELGFYAEDIIDYREFNDYTDVSQIRNAAPIPDELYVTMVPFLTVKSSNFYIKINVHLSQKDFYYHALLKRNQNNAKVTKFFKGTNKDYF
ncbi:MAG: general secretion pathway protein GspK [Flexistipes sinusarabici]|uniref:General secretion pathway protein GspK n=1 Tax=Flexistipes sinusarabici TaxID=2352 RepID=A0A5D0MM97_FLESI|nr:type II secretion system protein GspK [Flexistipes sinusarabici]TYB33075.1 MAG: general secretion pathway protein GspK [Flexistipes sinusarabici]